jgi:hypothetical protein
VFSDALNKPVAFHAIPSPGSGSFDLSSNQTVICGHVISSVGDGYNAETGVFTVSVSGVYCFMFSSTPNSYYHNDECGAFLMLDDVEIAFMFSEGRERCTAHAVVQAKSGQKVFPRSWVLPRNTFNVGWLTTFSGFLVQLEA